MAIAPMLAAAGVAGLSNIFTGIFGGIDRKKRRKRLQNNYGQIGDQFGQLGDQYGQLNNQFGNQIYGINSELGQSYLNTAEGSSFANRIGNTATNQRRSLGNMAGLSGISDEAFVSGLGRINQGEGQAMSNLSQNAEQRRRFLLSMRSQLGNQRMNALQGRGNALGNQFNIARGTEMDVMNGNAMFMQNLNQGLNSAATLGLQGLMGGGGSAKSPVTRWNIS